MSDLAANAPTVAPVRGAATGGAPNIARPRWFDGTEWDDEALANWANAPDREGLANWLNLSPEMVQQLNTYVDSVAAAPPNEPPAAAPAAPAGPVSGETNSRTFAQLQQQVNAMGLPTLFTFENGVPGGWLWEQILDGVTTAEELQVRLEATPEFRDRYGIILEQRDRRGRGEIVDVMTPAQVRAYELSAQDTLRNFGLPSEMWQDPRQMHEYIRLGLSAKELEERVTMATDWVQSGPPAVRDAFSQFFGVGQGDAALAAYFLDPALGTAMLEKQQRTAYVAGLGRDFGVNYSRDRAASLADLPMTQSGYQTNLARVAGLSEITRERFGEVRDMTLEGEATDAVFRGDGQAQGDLNRRVLERQRINRAGQGGAAVTQTGVSGLGTV